GRVDSLRSAASWRGFWRRSWSHRQRWYCSRQSFPNQVEASAGRRLRLRPRVLLEEARGAGEELDHVLLAGERAPLVLGDHVFHRHLALAQRADDEIRLGARDARIVRSGVDEEGSRDLPDVAERRDRLEEGGVLLRIAELDEEDLADESARRGHEGLHVGDAEEVDARAPQV